MKMISFCIALLLGACSGQDKEKIPIAILTPVTHPSLEQIENGFKETIEKENPGTYRFVTYNAQGSKTLMRGEIEEIAQREYPLVFTIGTNASQMTAEVFNKKQIDTPIVFTCVNDPVGFQIVPSEQTPGGHVTGVKELVDFEKEIDLLVQFKPTLRTLLLVYNPMEPGLDKDREKVKSLLQERNIELITAEIFQTNEILTKVSPLMQKSGALLVLKDNTVVSGLDVLVKLCKEHRTPLMASDLDSPDKGAAFAYGVYERDFGVEGAKKALEILNQHKKAGEIAVTPVSHFVLKVNRDAALSQGIDPERLQ